MKKSAFSGPKTFRDFRETGPWAVKDCASIVFGIIWGNWYNSPDFLKKVELLA